MRKASGAIGTQRLFSGKTIGAKSKSLVDYKYVRDLCAWRDNERRACIFRSKRERLSNKLIF
jgi:hypothetical protein